MRVEVRSRTSAPFGALGREWPLEWTPADLNTVEIERLRERTQLEVRVPEAVVRDPESAAEAPARPTTPVIVPKYRHGKRQ